MTKEQAKLCYILILIGIILICEIIVLSIYGDKTTPDMSLALTSFLGSIFVGTITALAIDLILKRNNHAYVLLSGNSEGEVFLGIYRNLNSARKALTKISITKKFKEINQDYWAAEDRLSYYSIEKEQIK